VADSLAERMTSPDLAHLLKVDAVMRGVVTRYKKKSVGRQVANALVFGYASGGEVRAVVAIYDGSDGQATWTYSINLTGEMFTTPDGLRKWAGHAVAVTFPYKKPKH